MFGFVLASAGMSRGLPIMVCLMFGAPAFAMTGNAPPATGWAARPIVMIVDARDDLCTGTALAQDLVLTAAHCVVRQIQYTVKPYQTGTPVPVSSIVRHPRFDYASYAASRATADIALLKLAAPLPDIVVPAALAAPRRVAAGEMPHDCRLWRQRCRYGARTRSAAHGDPHCDRHPWVVADSVIRRFNTKSNNRNGRMHRRFRRAGIRRRSAGHRRGQLVDGSGR
jgi:hypothetical protein